MHIIVLLANCDIAPCCCAAGTEYGCCRQSGIRHGVLEQMVAIMPYLLAGQNFVEDRGLLMMPYLKSLLTNCILVAIFFVLPALPAQAETPPKHQPLYDLALDIDKDGKMDRAVLVLVGDIDEGFYAPDKSSYRIDIDRQRADLYIYLGEGTGPVDVTKPPTILETHIDRLFLGGFIS